MIDDPQAQTEVQEEPLEEPMPSSEPVEADNDASDEAELPDGVSDRTKEQFNKLKETNKALKEQLEKKQNIEPIFDSMRPRTESGLTQSQIDAVTDVDPTSGQKFLNEDKLNSLLTQSTQKAEQAIDQVNRFIEEQQTKEAFTAIPQLNPKAQNFDPELHKATRAYILDSMMNPQDYGGRQLSYREAGEIATKASKSEIAKVEAEASQQLAAKEQSSLEAGGRSDRRSQVNTTQEQLRDQVRFNNSDEALAALLGD